MRFTNYINESAAKGGVQKYFKELQKMPPTKAEKTMKNSWKELSNALKTQQLEDDAIRIINHHFKTNYKRLDQIDKLAISKLPSLNEDFKNYWKIIKNEAFPTLAFYPALTAWLELDKLLAGGGDFNGAKFGVYALFWLVLVSGKFVKMWQKWKKDHPDEYKKEGSKKNPFAVKKKKEEEFKFE